MTDEDFINTLAEVEARNLAENEDLALYEAGPLDRVKDAIGDLTALRTFIQSQFQDGVDYGAIPGTGAGPDGKPKKVLLLPGAQKAIMYFNARPKFRIERLELPDRHVEYITNCELISRSTEKVIGEGVGSCSSMEAKYRYRTKELACPECGLMGSVIKGKKEFDKTGGQGGWLCWAKKGGCGAKFKDDDPKVMEQIKSGVKAEHPSIDDVRNTILKMSQKRAVIAAAMTLGALAELFTQDMEEFETFDLPGATAAKSGASDKPPVTMPKAVQEPIPPPGEAPVKEVTVEPGPEPVEPPVRRAPVALKITKIAKKSGTDKATGLLKKWWEIQTDGGTFVTQDQKLVLAADGMSHLPVFIEWLPGAKGSQVLVGIAPADQPAAEEGGDVTNVEDIY